VNGAPVRVLLGLAPPDEQAIEELLYGSEELKIIAGGASASELIGVAAAHAADAILLSHDLPALDAGTISRLRAKGLRTIGVAASDAAAAALDELDVDAVLRHPFALEDLLGELREPMDEQAQMSRNGSAGAPTRERDRNGNVLAVIGSKGAPGASELALSLATLVARSWSVLLAEFDGDGGQLALRLGADPHVGSLLGAARALRRNDPELRELLSRWLAGGERGWPHVLLAPPDPQRTLGEVVVPGLAHGLVDLLAQQFALLVCDVGHRLTRSDQPDAAVRLHRDLLVCADVVVLVVGQRQEQLRTGFAQLQLLLDELSIARERIRVVVNGRGAPGASSTAETVAAITRELDEQGLCVDAWLPWDRRALSASVRLGLPLAGARPRGQYAKTLQRFLDSVLIPTTAKPLARKRQARTSTPEVGQDKVVREVALPWRR
jgi:Flp pilus assembly CpaE family ATPase